MSQLQFYFSYIEKAKPDTEINTIYGDAGNAVHKLCEKFINERNDFGLFIPQEKNSYDKEKYKSAFKIQWRKFNLTEKIGFNNQPLNKDEYEKALFNTLNFISQNPDIIIAEKKFLFPFINNEVVEINIKGFIDAIDPIHHIIYDWKTNSSLSDFTEHAKVYCYAYYKLYGVVPKAIYYYSKMDKKQQYQFALNEIMEFEKYLHNIINEIIEKGFDITKYSAGNWTTAFNEYAGHCQRESLQRENIKYIRYNIYKNHVKFFWIPHTLNEIIDKKFSYFISGHEFSPLFQGKKWDGKTHLYNNRNNILPLGLLSKLKKLIEDYNKYFNYNYHLELDKDFRKTFEFTFDEITDMAKNYELRYYQEDAVTAILDKKIGILELGTGAGKSLIAAEIIRKLKTNTLYVINRIELVDQTCEMFEDYLGIKCGKVSEGKMELYGFINVVSIQTINSIIKKENNLTKELLKYLDTVNLLIFDECHTIKDSGMYRTLAKNVSNAHYIVGLSGTAFRNDEHSLKMNSLVGDIIYKKSTRELVEEGYLSQTKCYFINNDLVYFSGNYHELYDEFITNNDERNNLIKEIIEKNKNKKILVLTKLIKHGEVLNEMIPDSKLITSNTKKIDRKEDFNNFKENEYSVLIGSVQIFGVGINLPDLDIIINASGNKTTVGTIQSIGRVMRKTENKDCGYYYDFCDNGIRYFEQAAKQRINILKEFGHEIEIV